MSGFSDFIAAGVDLTFYGTVDSDGYLNGGSLTAPANGATNGSTMLRLNGTVSADLAIATPTEVNIPGDNGSQGQFVFQAESPPAFTLENSVFKLATQALAQGTTTYADGDMTLGVLQPNEYNPADMAWILQSPAKRKSGSGTGASGWTGYIVPRTNAVPLGRAQLRTREAAVDRYRIVTNPVSMLMDGLVVDDTNFGTTGAPVIPFANDYPIFEQRFTGDGTQDEFVLAYAPAVNSAAQIRIRINGVLATITTDFLVNLSTRVITFQSGHIPTAGQKIIARIGFNP